jgi:hypothetical protein
MDASTRNTILWIQDQLRKDKPVHWMDRLSITAKIFVYIGLFIAFILSILIAFIVSHAFVWMVENQ